MTARAWTDNDLNSAGQELVGQARSRAKSAEDENEKLRAALERMDRLIIEAAMTDEQRRKMRGLVKAALA
ncbi:MAG: hypothetical protein KAS66_05405 [Candidatus Omnitrophica bacterium]|nr:hypothetical protein [Candidatus Omnitrophota bacterium]